MTTFTPSNWVTAGQAMRQGAEDMYAGSHGVIRAKPLTARTSSPIEGKAVAGDALCNVPWHRLIAYAKESMAMTGSKMVATGEDYSATEEEAATQRFWQ